MSDVLLTTKLYTPPTRPQLVPRLRLLDKLKQGLYGKLTLVSAPAGFGKTTLVSEWLRTADIPFTWLSLDAEDNDPVRFLTYFLAALQRMDAAIGKAILPLGQASQHPSIEALMPTLINDVAATTKQFVLVLDDYHVIETQAIHRSLTFLLDHLPPQMHLVIISRVDPPLPLPRLRIRAALSELRVTDLRFDADEMTTFFNQLLGLNLTSDDIAALESRTEGWVAGLQVAGLSLQGRDDEQRHQFIKAFAGSHRYIVDYLTEEVIQQQSDCIQSFLINTAILSRLTGPLCDALTGENDGHTRLAQLEVANLFIIPLDEERRWYRYHHLFADLLYERLQQTQPDLIPELHRRAAAWYEQNELTSEAINHALAAEDFEQAARLVEQTAGQTLGSGEAATLLRWLETLPETLIRSQPGLGLFHAWALLFNGQLDAVESRLEDVEHSFRAKEDNEKSSLNRDFLDEITAIRAIVACYRGKPSLAIQLSRQALEIVTPDNHFLQSILAINIALNIADAYGSPTDVADAHQLLTEAIAISQRIGDIYMALMSLSMQANIEVAQGRLHQAYDTFRRALCLADESTEQGKQSLPVVGMANVGLGDVLREWNELEAALHHVGKGIDLEQPGGDFRAIAMGYFTLARVYQAKEKLDRAQNAIEQAAQFAQQSNITWLVSKIEAYQARLWLAQDNLAAAIRWSETCGLKVGDEIGYQREGEYTFLARILVAQGKFDEAVTLLQWLQAMTEPLGLMGSVIEILALQALAFAGQDDIDQAMTALARALILAEPEGYIRLFVDDGTPMATLLQQAANQKIAPNYVRKLLAAYSPSTSVQKSPPAGSSTELILDPLSEREVEVLQLIADGLSNREIAETLIISPGTVKVHVKNIYSKLDVHNRTQAAIQARELNLLS